MAFVKGDGGERRRDEWMVEEDGGEKFVLPRRWKCEYGRTCVKLYTYTYQTEARLFFAKAENGDFCLSFGE